MDIIKLTKKIITLTSDIEYIEKSIIKVYIDEASYNYEESAYLVDYFSDLDLSLYSNIKDYINEAGLVLDINALIEVFELLVPNKDKKTNGMVYTPIAIKDYIIASLVDYKEVPTICDPACGCGSFLLSAADYLNAKFNISFNEIIEKYIYGVDIISHNIKKTKTLFHVLALHRGEVIQKEFNLKSGDSLKLNWDKEFNNIKFDLVIGNPPYVRSRNISPEVKKSLVRWETTKTGNADLYIPFFELGLEILNEKGKLGYISINTFLKSLNGRSLRAYLKKKQYDIKVIDFKDFQMFKNVTSYTCIILIDKSSNKGILQYSAISGLDLKKDIIFTDFNYLIFNETSAWKLGTRNIIDNIKKIENVGINLGDYRIRNGLATLKNDIYFFKPLREDDNYFIREYDGNEYKIEKKLCIDVAKPNVIKSEEQLSEKMEKAIFPYKNFEGSNLIISEEVMKKQFPLAYSYLFYVKEILDKRDKGNGKYPEWYAYGRTQSMDSYGKKLFIPYMSDRGIAVLSPKEEVLFYCGYAIFHDDMTELMVLKKIIESDIFWYYIEHTSKPYAKGYYSLAKNYIKEFGIPELSDKEKKTILTLNTQEEVNIYLRELYEIVI